MHFEKLLQTCYLPLLTGFLFSLNTLSSAATPVTYYISADGNDAADGLSPGSAWQSIAHLNNQVFDPGDVILFRRGDVFRQTFKMTSSGTEAQPILISAYGEGRKPVFSLPAVTEWEDQGDGVFRAPIKTSDFSGVWEDQIPMQPRASNRSLKDGRWFGSDQFLYVRPTSDNPNNHEITAIERIYSFESGIWLSDQKYVTISGLTFQSVPVGVYTRDLGSGTEGLIVEDCDFHYCHNAIFFLPNESHNRKSIVRNNYFYRNHNGVRLFTGSALAPGPNINGEHLNCSIINNEFVEEGTWNGAERWDYGFTDYEAIGLQNFSGGIIADNYIHDGVSIGIIFYNFKGLSSDDNLIVRNRIIDNNRVSLFFTGEGNQTDASYSYSANMISHNVFAGEKESTNPGIWIDQGSLSDRPNYFVHNVCVGRSHHIQITQSTIPAYFNIQNNIFYGLEFNLAIYQTETPSNLTLDYNLYYSEQPSMGWFVEGNTQDADYMQNLGYEKNSIFADPKFVSPEDHDFHLKEDSPARKAGVPIEGLIEDAEGNELTQAPDLGVFQHNGSTTPASESNGFRLIELYPNPMQSELFLKNVDPGADFIISNLMGRTVIEGSIEEDRIDVSTLRPGVYHLMVQEQNHRVLKL